jgi:uroporphyrin-III C-methyltransferase
MPRKVYIVGAGPGAADLLTLRAAALLREADVVLHDDLVSQEILDLCQKSATIVNVGKRCGRHGSSQEQINALMVRYATEDQHLGRNERTIIRLKSGDPSIFGRLGEELDALRRNGIPIEIVPGITAAACAAASAEITLTDRRTASALVIVTGHNCGKESPQKTIFDPGRSTYAIYMPGPDYGRTARELLQSGLEPSTPCAVVSNAGGANQQTRLLMLADVASAQGISAPALLIVGDVARSVPALEEAYPPASEHPENLSRFIAATSTAHASYGSERKLK